MTKTLAVAGRPNVGKSTLFNRLVGARMALVSDEPGVTRDWREGEGQLFDLRFRVIDTAGLEDVRAKGSLSARTAARTQQALAQTDIILLVVDGRAGLTPEDRAIARELRKSGKKIILLANKCEGTYLPDNFDQAAALGFGDPLPISASHGEGLGELYETLAPYFPERVPEEPKPRRAKAKPVVKTDDDDADDDDATPEAEKSLHVAIVGRPNAGKSTLLNQLIGADRMLTGPEPGLTRDAIAIAWTYKDRPVRLVDTAGLRRRARVTEKLEKMSGHESLRAIRLAHVVVLVIDASKPFDKQDLAIAHHVVEEGRALVVAINKWDDIKDREKKPLLKEIAAIAASSLSQVSGLPLVPISALRGQGLDELMRAVMKIYATWNKRVSTGKLNRWLQVMEDEHPPPITSGRRIKLRYITQIKARPPTFSLWVNKPVDLPDSYQRFLTHGLRDDFDLQGVPIRWQLKKSENPYEDKKRR